MRNRGIASIVLAVGAALGAFDAHAGLSPQAVCAIGASQKAAKTLDQAARSGVDRHAAEFALGSGILSGV